MPSYSHVKGYYFTLAEVLQSTAVSMSLYLSYLKGHIFKFHPVSYSSLSGYLLEDESLLRSRLRPAVTSPYKPPVRPAYSVNYYGYHTLILNEPDYITGTV